MRGSFWSVENVLKLMWWCLHNAVNILNTIELYSLNVKCMVCELYFNKAVNVKKNMHWSVHSEWILNPYVNFTIILWSLAKFLFIKLCRSCKNVSFVCFTTNLKNTVLYVLRISPWWIWVLHNYNFQLKAQILLLAINPDSYFLSDRLTFFFHF